jgi:hypothetical protein
MVSLLILLLACSSPPLEETSAPAPAAAAAVSVGSIGGEPILPSPMIIGGIANAVVEQEIVNHMEGINGCYEAALAAKPRLAGKVLVKFQIGMDGSVANPSTRSTSLRDEATEACVNAEVAKLTFPPLERGRVAIVHYPFVFPAPSSTN